MTHEEYLNDRNSDSIRNKEETTIPEWLSDWEYYLDQYQDELCEARTAEDYTDYIDGEYPFKDLEIGTIFLTDAGYMVKISDIEYATYLEGFEDLAEYWNDPMPPIWRNPDEPVLATNHCV